MIEDNPFAPTAADLARQKAELEKYDSPAEVAKREAKRKAEFERGVRLGWWNEDGDPIEQPEDETEDDEEDE